MSSRWVVRVSTLKDRELWWEYTYPVQGNNDVELRDPATGELLGTANNWRLELCQELPKAAVEELLITGTAALMALVSLGPMDLQIAMEGPEGHEKWERQE